MLIAGCGYVGLALGARLSAKGHLVFGVRRSPSAARLLQSSGVEPLIADLGRAEHLEALPREWDWVVFCAAPDGGGEEAYRDTYFTGVCRLLDWLRPSPPRALVFTGSTSVYGQLDGSVVTEASSTAEASGTARILLETEELLREAAGGGFPARLLRVAGIYGPDRHRIGALIRGEARLTGEGERFMNWIHRDDLVAAILAVLEHGRDGEVYNVSDGAPAREREFYGWLTEHLGLPMPPTTSGPEAVQRRRALTDRQISVDKLRRDLGWTPAYPSFREGYAPLIAAWRA